MYQHSLKSHMHYNPRNLHTDFLNYARFNIGKMFTPSKSDNQSGEQYNAAYNAAQSYNNRQYTDLMQFWPQSKKDLFSTMGTDVNARTKAPGYTTNPYTLNAMNNNQDLANWYSGQRASYTPGYINPEIDAAERANLANQWNGTGGSPGAKALAEEQFAGPGGYWGNARSQGVMDAYTNAYTNPYQTWRSNALQNSYTNANQYVSTLGALNNTNTTTAQGVQDRTMADALSFMGLQTGVYDPNIHPIDPNQYALAQGKTSGSNGIGGTIGGVAGGILGTYFGGPAGGALVGNIGYGIGSGFDSKGQPLYSGYGMSPTDYSNSFGGVPVTANSGNYNAQPALNAYSNALGSNGNVNWSSLLNNISSGMTNNQNTNSTGQTYSQTQVNAMLNNMFNRQQTGNAATTGIVIR